MGDVVGALPIYLPEHKIEASVVIPKYRNRWYGEQAFTTVKKGKITLGDEVVPYAVQKLKEGTLGYPFYCIDIPGKFDRENIYLGADGHGYKDEIERNLSFQLAILDWLNTGRQKFDGLHCHDHMTGLITFFIKHCPEYEKLATTPTFFTIHNGQYRGIMSWAVDRLFPAYDSRRLGLLDWDASINSLAASIKCAWAVNTVSPTYMRELERGPDTMTTLYKSERPKCKGILNGIDVQLWDPASDQYLEHHLKADNWVDFKKKNKQALLKKMGLKSRRPLFGFIGRMAHQKGADILADAVQQLIADGQKISVAILGSGDKAIEDSLLALAAKHKDSIAVTVAYDEGLSRSIYAASDFLLMPSRFEPCGLNQMYAMRYGTVPVVTKVGGLVDTVPDISQGGNGIVSEHISSEGLATAMSRAVTLYGDKLKMTALRDKITAVDHSWSKSAADYKAMYSKYL